MKVSELAEKAAVPADTVRYYTRIGLLVPKINANNGYKQFNEQDLKRLLFICHARQLGFTLEDIQSILSEADKGSSPCPLVRSVIENRMQEVKTKLDAMTALYGRMQQALQDWAAMPDQSPCGDSICHLIESEPRKECCHDTQA